MWKLITEYCIIFTTIVPHPKQNSNLRWKNVNKVGWSPVSVHEAGHKRRAFPRNKIQRKSKRNLLLKCGVRKRTRWMKIGGFHIKVFPTRSPPGCLDMRGKIILLLFRLIIPPDHWSGNRIKAPCQKNHKIQISYKRSPVEVY